MPPQKRSRSKLPSEKGVSEAIETFNSAAPMGGADALAEPRIRAIRLRGGRIHNLKDISVDIPLGKLVSICGLSGSGKSSLAIDTLFAEGQRRYIESFSPQLRQLLPRPERAEFDRLDNLPAAIAVRRTNQSHSESSTVSTVTEIDDFLRILFAGLASLHCPKCQREIIAYDAQLLADWLGSQRPARAMIAFAFAWSDASELAIKLSDFQQAGFTRIVLGNQTWSLVGDDRKALAQATQGLQCGFVVVDRIQAGEKTPRVQESLETTFHWGDDRVVIWQEQSPSSTISVSQSSSNIDSIDGRTFQRTLFSRLLECDACGLHFALPEPSTFHPSMANKDEAMMFRLNQQTIGDIRRKSLDQLSRWCEELANRTLSRANMSECFAEIHSRLKYLRDVGLGYLQLDRMISTLSGGESARLGLTRLLGSNLVDMLYVLDEPSVGLHPTEVQLLLDALIKLRRRGNTIVMIEHEPELLRQSDWIIELGPGAGNEGGRVVFEGTWSGLVRSDGPTGDYFKRHRTDSERQMPATINAGEVELQLESIKLAGISGRNLKNLTVEIPLRKLCVVAGVSGSGKSSLVLDTLVPAIRRSLGLATDAPLPFESLSGHETLRACEAMDASPVTQAQRSSPATYSKILDELRRLFASTPDAQRLGWNTSYFSYNSPLGQCDRCQGDGRLIVDMHFMSNVESSCPECSGRGYRHEVLNVHYRNRSIADCLDMSIEDAKSFFRGEQKLQRKLSRLTELGLGYIPLGQRLSTLSAGELQRLKLANILMENKASTLFVMDEPTTGLHFSDVARLIQLLRAMVRDGHSVVVVEHNLQMIEAADYVMELGPGPGDFGGSLITVGAPTELAQNPNSQIGQFLYRSPTAELSG